MQIALAAPKWSGPGLRLGGQVHIKCEMIPYLLSDHGIYIKNTWAHDTGPDNRERGAGTRRRAHRQTWQLVTGQAKPELMPHL